MIRSISLQLLLLLLTATVLAAQTNEGTEFYLSFPASLEDASPSQEYIRLYIMSSVATNVDIYTLGQLKGSVTTVPNGIVTFDLSKSEAQLMVREVTTPVPSDRLYEKSAVRVVSDDPISLHCMNRRSHTSDGFLALPVIALGREYIVASAADNIPVPTNVEFPSQFMVVAPHDSTSVTITFAMATPNHSAGETITVPMMKGDVYSAMSVGFKGDLTGSIIRADKPVAVMAGQVCTYLPDENHHSGDHLVEMLTPVETWGRSYYAMPIAERTKGDTYRVFAAEAGTDIVVNGVTITTIDQVGGAKGEGWIEFREETRRPLLFASNKPINVVQYNNGQDYDRATSTDPFYMVLSPVRQYVGAATFTTPSNDFAKNFVGIVADSVGMATMEITRATLEEWIPLIDFPGVRLWPMPQSGGTAFIGATLPIQPGAYRLRSGGRFSAMIYGGSQYDSYGFPAALGLKSEKEEIVDMTAPSIIARVSCDGTIVGEIVDGVGTSDDGSGIVDVALDPLVSSNASLELDGSLASRPRRIGFRIWATDPSAPGTAVLIIRDGAGNERRDTIDLSSVGLTYSADRLDFHAVGVGSVVRRTALLLNDGLHDITIDDARLARGDAGFRLVDPFTPTTIDVGDTLHVVIELTGDEVGAFHDTLILTDSCGRSWPLAVTAIVDAELGDVVTAGAAIAGMRLTIAPNVIDGDAIALTYAVPTGRSATLRLIDADGRTVSSRTLTSTGGIDRRTTLDASSLPGGRYWVALRIDGSEIIEEISIVR